MKYFLDTEFSERGPFHPISLISIGIVAEDGREFYAEHQDRDFKACNDWVRANVLPHLIGPPLSLDTIAGGIESFVGDDTPEFWGYYADYDWVVFAQIFGTMMGLPKGWPMYCRDLKQWCDQLGNPTLPPQYSTEHNALNDARWNFEVFKFLENQRGESTQEVAGEAHCIHPQLQLQLVVPEECLVRGDIGAWYHCQRCGEDFRSDIKPYKIEIEKGETQ